jgi:RimJ/RimL family protein N-acetyltransferase
MHGDAPTSEQARLIANLKTAALGDTYIPIHLPEGGITGYLTPITEQLAGDAEVVDALFRWREKHMSAFLTVFVPTKEKTRGYLCDFSLPNSARLLFLIKDQGRRPIGHIGLCNIAPGSAEVDNVIRGEPVNIPHFMILVHNALLDWTFSALGVPMVYLNVLDHNTRALRTYQKVGFSETSRVPLSREAIDGGYKLVPAKDCTGSPGPTLIRMELQRDSFYRQRGR